MKKRILWMLLFSMLLTGCSGEKQRITEPESQETTEDTKAGEGVYTFTDALGREISVENPQRVAALLGSFADIWHLAGGTVVAAADDAWEDYELELSEDAVNLGMTKDVSLEKLFEANPDLVLASSNTKGNVELLDTLENAGILVAYFEVNDFSDYLEMLKICTEITGRADLYEQNGLQIKEQIDAIAAQSQKRIEKSGKAPKVLLLRASSTFIRAKNSQDNVPGEMLKALGCVNIADSDETLLENLSIEHIIMEDPDYIFFVQQGDHTIGTMENIENLITENPAWQELTAVKTEHIYLLDKSLYSLKPNDRWAEAFEKLEGILSDE